MLILCMVKLFCCIKNCFNDPYDTVYMSKHYFVKLEKKVKLPYNFAKNGLAGDKIMHLALKRLSLWLLKMVVAGLEAGGIHALCIKLIT